MNNAKIPLKKVLLYWKFYNLSKEKNLKYICKTEILKNIYANQKQLVK